MPNKRPPVFPKNAYKSSTLGKRAADHIIGQKSIIKEIAKPQHKVRGVGRVVKMNFVFDDSADYLVLDNFVPPGLLNGNLYMTDQYGWLKWLETNDSHLDTGDRKINYDLYQNLILNHDGLRAAVTADEFLMTTGVKGRLTF